MFSSVISPAEFLIMAGFVLVQSAPINPFSLDCSAWNHDVHFSLSDLNTQFRFTIVQDSQTTDVIQSIPVKCVSQA